MELWKKNNTYSLAEAALLIVGICPDAWPVSKLLEMETPNGFKAVVNKMIEDAKEEIGTVTSTHEDFLGQYYEEYVLMTHDANDLKNRTYEDWLSTKISKGTLREWVTINGYSQVFDDTVNPPEDKSVNNLLTQKRKLKEESILGIRERKSLHRIIGALLDTFEQHPGREFKNDSQIIQHLVEEYEGYEGLSTSNLTLVFPASRKALIN